MHIKNTIRNEAHIFQIQVSFNPVIPHKRSHQVGRLQHSCRMEISANPDLRSPVASTRQQWARNCSLGKPLPPLFAEEVKTYKLAVKKAKNWHTRWARWSNNYNLATILTTNLQDMSKVCHRYVKICPTYPKFVPKLVRRHAHHMPKLCPRYT